MIPRIAIDAERRLKWKVAILKYDDTVKVEENLEQGHQGGRLKRSFLKEYAKQTNASFVVFYDVHEFTGFNSTGHFYGVGDHIGGRTSLTATVYDASKDKLCWRADQIAVSTASEGSSMGQRMDLSLYDALSKAVSPFFKEGHTSEVKFESKGYVATVKQVLKDKKSVLLDVGASADASVGDELESLSGSARLKLTQILDNGSIADVVEGDVSVGDVFKSKED